MSWTDVRDYLKTSDMVIIPIASTEQHGPHLPLGTDYYEATGISKLISARTGVVVAHVLLVGYSEYHSGFPGSLSLKPETMEQVLFETAEMLMRYGFRRFMFFNYHGGNNIVQQRVIHRINHTTEERAEKPKAIYSEKLQALWMLSQQYPGLLMVFNSLRGVPVETKKGGASHELYSNGIWSFSDPKKATKERGEKQVKGMADYAVKFIEAWKKAKR